MRKQFVLVLMVMSIAGCSRKRPAETPTPANTPSAPPAATAEDPTASATAAAEAARREAERRRGVIEQRVHFEFDRADLTDDARDILGRKLPILNSDAGISIRVEGHADERGSVEYNLALSLRRANSARAYLIDGGVASHRIEVAAFGEERPLATGTGESAWSLNRRAEFRITSGF